MVSLWGSKRQANGDENDDPDQNRAAGGNASDEQGREPDERTRLLPSQDRQGYLDPDDPAVSPYNLWSVRALRFLSIFFLAISFLWWILLFISIFISPPAMHSRGSGFLDVSFTTLTVGNLVVAILFFSIPSKAQEISNIVLAVIIFIDMVLILAVPQIRSEEGWVGIASVAWAFFIALFLVFTDRIVAWGKQEEEERLTGRRETRRSLREWCAVLTNTVVNVILIIVVLLLMANVSLRVKDTSLVAPGERYYVDDNKYQVHLSCVGNSSSTDGEPNPTFLVEAGEQPFKTSLEEFIQSAWISGTISRYCYWDRPGIGFSDNAPSPFSAGMAAESLSNALAQAGEEGPWILVSAGMGSIYSRIFSSRHVSEVRGIMLIDPVHENRLYEVGDAGRGFLLWAQGFVSPLGLQRLPGAIFRGRTSADRVYGRVAPQGGKFLKAKLQENLVAATFTRSEISQARSIQQRDTPLVVVSSGIKVRSDRYWQREQQDMTKITDNLVVWDVVSQAPHEVWETRTGREVLEQRLGELAER